MTGNPHRAGGPDHSGHDRDRRGRDHGEETVYVISVAAQLAGMHAQTLRGYDRQGLVSPERTAGGGRRYSMRDIELLREVQRLSQEQGVNLAGIKRIIELENEVDALRAQVAELTQRLTAAFARDIVPRRQETAIVVWKPRQ